MMNDEFMKVRPLFIGNERLTPVICEMDGRRRPDMFTDKMLDRYRRMGYTLRFHPESGFTFIYK